ncbi:DHHW family protein [Bacillus sp. D386]|uniref:DHHW family protein n=1 Tax=Bacillus sp. D386 TaxID=2587155 RepID=UPI001124C9FC|nr:DHHW family protein [Bacillus sp. D386]
MEKKASQYFIAIFFLCSIFIFGIWSLIDNDRVSSEMEGRTLEKRPDLNLETVTSGDYFSRFEDYYNDSFPLRNQWIETNSSASHKVFGQHLFKGVYINDDGYLISTVELDNPQESIKRVHSKINDFTTELKEKDIPVFFALTPNKTTMLEYQLPDYIESRANELSDELSKGFNEDVNLLDLRSAIEPHMDEENMYFYTDHHWKPKAAYYAYSEIIRNMNMQIPDIGQPLPMSSYNWREDITPFYGSEARKVGRENISQADTITIVEKKSEGKPLEISYRGKSNQPLFNEEVLKKEDVYTNRYVSYFSGDVPEGIIQNPNVQNGKRVLILKDSYANAMIQFFPSHFEETRILDLRYYKHMTVKDYINKNDIDAVVFVHNINSILITPQLIKF